MTSAEGKSSSFTAGITGNIGAGKSTVAGIFAKMGFPVFYSDEVSRHILASDPEVHRELRNLFGEEIFTEGEPDRKKLAARVFSDSEKLAALNGLMHPRVKNAFEEWKRQQSHWLLFREAAILIESGLYTDLDEIVLVTCPEPVRIQRVVARDGVSEAQVADRIRHQMPEEEKKKFATFVIENDGTRLLLPQVLQFLKEARHRYENS